MPANNRQFKGMSRVKNKVGFVSLEELRPQEFSLLIEDVNRFHQPLDLYYSMEFSKNLEHLWFLFKGLMDVVRLYKFKGRSIQATISLRMS